MPTIAKIFGLRVTIYPNDHRPAHIHIIGQGREAVFNLNCPNGPIDLRENYGFTHKELTKIISAQATNLEMLCSEWGRIHGTY